MLGRRVSTPAGDAYVMGVQALDASGNPSVNNGPMLPTGTDRSGTIAAGAPAQQLAPANANRRYLRGQNLSTGDLWLNEVGGTASAASPSFRIPAGGTFGINTNQAVSIWGATTGQAWSATEG
ncbi:hypothetical protein ASE65_10475 [Sphingomonas sp. Leaf16]|nr:hypothetical protein ASE65_10475 [Sphingomonas sp. Leaf16]KQN11035.1 hypothetical protein ASE81_11460 [Sphingomonas sp. Leaf29]KQN18337.1 hypothetical protein ASE83_11400 [Sphingomonas sp. Leaf32]